MAGHSNGRWGPPPLDGPRKPTSPCVCGVEVFACRLECPSCHKPCSSKHIANAKEADKKAKAAKGKAKGGGKDHEQQPRNGGRVDQSTRKEKQLEKEVAKLKQDLAKANDVAPGSGEPGDTPVEEFDKAIREYQSDIAKHKAQGNLDVVTLLEKKLEDVQSSKVVAKGNPTRAALARKAQDKGKQLEKAEAELVKLEEQMLGLKVSIGSCEDKIVKLRSEKTVCDANLFKASTESLDKEASGIFVQSFSDRMPVPLAEVQGAQEFFDGMAAQVQQFWDAAKIVADAKAKEQAAKEEAAKQEDKRGIRTAKEVLLGVPAASSAGGAVVHPSDKPDPNKPDPMDTEEESKHLLNVFCGAFGEDPEKMDSKRRQQLQECATSYVKKKVARTGPYNG